MLKPEDIEIHMGRGVGGDFLNVVHKPTGISRGKGPPLKTPGKVRRELLREVEAELIARGLMQYIVPERRTTGEKHRLEQ